MLALGYPLLTALVVLGTANVLAGAALWAVAWAVVTYLTMLERAGR